MKDVLDKYLLVLLVALGVGCGWFFTSRYYEAKLVGEKETQRQLEGKLTEKEAELVSAKADARQLQSALVTRDTLLKEFKDNTDLNNARMRELIKKYDLKLDSLSTVVGEIKGFVSGGSSSATPLPDGSFSYEWSDKDLRFHLLDPDIKIQGNETFNYNQKFKMDVSVFRQPAKDGSLRVQNLVMREILSDGTPVGDPAVIDYTKSTFQFAPDDYASMDSPGQRINLGLTSSMEPLLSWEPLRYKAFGFGPAVYGDKREQSIGLGATWYPRLKRLESQIGVGVVAGYSTESQATVRAYVAVTIGKIRKKGA